MFLILSNLQFWCVSLGQVFRMVSITSINLLRHVSQNIDTFGGKEGWLSERLVVGGGEPSQRVFSLFPRADPLPHCLLFINILFIHGHFLLFVWQVNSTPSVNPSSNHLQISTLIAIPCRIQANIDLSLYHLWKLPMMPTILKVKQIPSADFYLSPCIQQIFIEPILRERYYLC